MRSSGYAMPAAKKRFCICGSDRFAGLVLDETLDGGAWRALTEAEIALLQETATEKDKITENL